MDVINYYNRLVSRLLDKIINAFTDRIDI